jgi:hypothetical protein
MSKPRKTLSLKGITPEQEALITRQEAPRIERIEKENPPAPEQVEAPVEKDEEKTAPEPIIEKEEPKVLKTASPKPAPEAETEDSDAKQTVKKKKTRKRAPAKSPVTEEAPEPWITKTYRLPGSLIDRLQMISLERRIKKVTPNTQQELLAQALTEWLEKNEE